MERVSIVGKRGKFARRGMQGSAVLQSIIRLYGVFIVVPLLMGLSLTFFTSGNVAQAAGVAGSNNQAIPPTLQTSQMSPSGAVKSAVQGSTQGSPQKPPMACSQIVGIPCPGSDPIQPPNPGNPVGPIGQPSCPPGETLQYGGGMLDPSIAHCVPSQPSCPGGEFPSSRGCVPCPECNASGTPSVGLSRSSTNASQVAGS